MVSSTLDSEALETMSDAAMFNSTVLLPTTPVFPARQTVTPEIVATVGLIVCSIGACTNALVLAVLVRARRHFGSCVHSLIANQSAMDLFACMFAIATFVMMLTHGFKYNGNEILDGTICVLFEAGALITLVMTEGLGIINLYTTTVTTIIRFTTT